MKKQAKDRLPVMDKVVDHPQDVLPRDLFVKDKVAVRPPDEPDEDLPMQDDVVDRLSNAPPSIDLTCNRSGLPLSSVSSVKLNIIRFAPLSRSKWRWLFKKQKLRLKKKDKEDSTVEPPSSSSHAGVSPPFGVSSPAITS